MAKEYNISKPSGRCRKCDRPLEPKEEFVATVREVGEELTREDFCLACWEGHDHKEGQDIFGVWHAHIPQPQEKKKILVNDEVIITFFERLEAADDPVKLGFRYVLALVLMRKKLLVYDRMERREGQEIWLMRFRGSDKVHRVVDPRLDEEKIAEVSQSLGAIMEGQL